MSTLEMEWNANDTYMENPAITRCLPYISPILISPVAVDDDGDDDDECNWNLHVKCQIACVFLTFLKASYTHVLVWHSLLGVD